MNHHTDFEKPRGVNHVEVRDGYAQVHVSALTGNRPLQRLEVLEAVAMAEVSLDFLKLTQSGLSFLVPENRSEDVERALAPLGAKFSLHKGRSIVLVHAVNMRDEEGLIAGIVRDVILSGATVSHISDMHNRMLMVVQTPEAAHVADRFRESLMEVTA